MRERIVYRRIDMAILSAFIPVRPIQNEAGILEPQIGILRVQLGLSQEPSREVTGLCRPKWGLYHHALITIFGSSILGFLRPVAERRVRAGGLTYCNVRIS